MVTLQDISIQLMKPAKDLADWKFPLSQILEEYYALLEEPCAINFGEAALVLQNSTNVYVRRIDCLLGETEDLRQAFLHYEEEKIKKALSKRKKGLKKDHIDFENFVIINLEKDVGKQIDKKSHLQAQKKVKLLSHRFTQLENNLTPLCIPIHMYDVAGEVIGKKYDFRCNQNINTSGMLVDELTPYDFTCMLGSRLQKGRNSLSFCSEPKTPGTGTSGYHSITLQNDESIMLIPEDFEDNASSVDSNSIGNELEVIEKENNNNSLFAGLLDEAVTKKGDLEKQNAAQNNNLKGIQNSREVNETKKGNQETEDLAQTSEIKGNSQKTDKIDKNGMQVNISNQRGFKKHSDRNCKEGQLCEKKEELVNARKKGNQTRKVSMCSVDDINENDWKPMPFVQGTKHDFCDDSPVLKLPDYISFLGTKSGSIKRKSPSKLRKPECLTKLVLREAELLRKKDPTSQAKQKFKHLQKEELEDFMKNFDQCFNGAEKENNNCRYEAVTNTIDLLGFRVCQDQENCTENETEDTLSRSSSPAMRLPSPLDPLDLIASSPNSMDMIANSPNNRCDSSVSEINLFYSLPDYQSLIEYKMKEIFKESNVTTELDQTVARWHASLQSKLSEVEIRPAFRIHDYAAHIIKALKALQNKKTSFDSVVQDKPAFEVARYFLASLQLANTYNVEIRAEDSDNGIELTLLDNESRKKD